MTSAGELPVAPLHRRLGAMGVNAGVGVLAMAGMSALGIVIFKVGERLPGRRRVVNRRSCAAGESAGRTFSPPSKHTMSAMGLVGSVVARNWRSPGAKVMHIRKVDARTGGPISVRSTVIGSLVGELWGALLNRLFAPYEKPRRDAGQAKMQAVQQELRDLQREHAGDDEALQRAQMELYKRHGINPLSSCRAFVPKMIAGQVPRLFTPQHRTLSDWIAGIAIVSEPRGGRSSD